MPRRGAASRLALCVQYASGEPGLPPRPTVRRWVAAALVSAAAITVRYVDEAEGRRLNRHYRGKNRATNVLAFAYQGPTRARPLLGDIVICAPVVAEEARAQGKALAAHHAHLLVHGVLHLEGFDHERREAAERMEMREREILGNLGIPDPYAA